MADPSPRESQVSLAPGESHPDQIQPEPPTTKASTRPSARGTAFYQRKRAVRACQVCRARRTKCDNLKPSCSFCLKVGATCIQSPIDLSSFDPASLKILERLDDLEELMRSVSVDGPSNKTRVVEGPVERRLEEPPQVGPPIELGMILPSKPEDIMGWTIFQSLGNVIDRDETALSADHGSVIASSPASVLGALEEPRQVNGLLDSFFNYVHVKNPILDETATRKMVSNTVMQGVDWSSESCLTLLIFALGSIATPFGPSHENRPGTEPHNKAQSLFQAAQKRLGVLLSSDDIIAAQCLFLSGVYMMCTFQPVKAWRYFVQALASCQQFPFLTPEAQQRYHNSMKSGNESENYSIDTLQQAVYWSSWKSEREMRGDLYLPDFSLSDKELAFYPPFFPTPPTARAEVEATLDPRLTRERTSWYFYLSEISLRRLASRISAEMVGLQKLHPTRHAYLTAAAAAVPQYEEQAKEWIGSLPLGLSFDEPPEEDDVCRFVLRGHAINLFEQIYWPFTTACLDSLKANPSLPREAISATTVALAQKGLDNHLFRLFANQPGFYHRHHGTLPMLRSCSRSALVLVAAALAIHADGSRGGDYPTMGLAMPTGWRTGVEGMVDILNFWEGESHQVQKLRRFLEQGYAMIPELSPTACRPGS
ncbi:C6 zinc finger domain-containing protein [Colletotrichum truncatum]|uniref:C6 zinc finger domain-containing protein n=1 Tax=Colletotrichum truncatum TaxID=5467 RepID=A0ACC3ZB59_COLTU|nr:C6 zinc finger domain-containing protein [Colletotrichum truncatum]KAF6787657.1 C6 zinc finger domain-containing protein [Colletotrichum truncatum]